MDKKYDIIIGTGSGKATIADKLTLIEKKMLLLEQEGFIPKENWDTVEVFTNGRYSPDKKWLDNSSESFTRYCISESDRFTQDNTYIDFKRGISGVSHPNGTCRFGTNSSIFVLNTNCKLHNLSRLHTLHSSISPFDGTINPALTIIANTLRVGEHLIKNLN